MRRRQGFTLVEMLVVIIIIVIVAGATIALMTVFLRGSGVRRGASIVTQAVAETKARAAETHKYHFIVFAPSEQGGGVKPTDGWVEIHRDMNNNGIYDGDDKPDTKDGDISVTGTPIQMPKFVTFFNAPAWIGIAPSGYMTFGGSFQDIQSSSFDANMNGANPSTLGDVIIQIEGRPYFMLMDLDRASGKVRRQFLLNKDS